MSRSAVFFSVLLLAALWFPSPVMAKSIKMLPPEQSNTSDTPCEEGEGDKILTWNGESALKCNKGVTIDKSGNVGIGTTAPKAKLSVNGGVQANNDSDTCVAAKAGTIRWNGSAFEGCNGSAWKEFHTGPSFGGIYQTYLCNEKNVFSLPPATGGCRRPNPITSSCTCPTGYQSYHTNDFNDPEGSTSCPQQYYEKRGMISWVCIKY